MLLWGNKMKNAVSTSGRDNQNVSSFNRPRDLKSLWNYFFDFGSSDMGDLEPKIDVTDSKDSVKVIAEMPGINEENIDLKISEEGYLTISGQKQHTSENSDKNSYFSEISYGMFKRTIPLPWDLDYHMADADYENGVLTVNIPKTQTEKQKYKKINLKKKGQETKSSVQN